MDGNQEKIEQLRTEIAGHKQVLASTDYKCLKYTDGALTDEQYEPVRIQRANIRAIINDLEDQIEKLENEK